jgi:hypothetical protein
MTTSVFIFVFVYEELLRVALLSINWEVARMMTAAGTHRPGRPRIVSFARNAGTSAPRLPLGGVERISRIRRWWSQDDPERTLAAAGRNERYRLSASRSSCILLE